MHSVWNAHLQCWLHIIRGSLLLTVIIPYFLLINLLLTRLYCKMRQNHSLLCFVLQNCFTDFSNTLKMRHQQSDVDKSAHYLNHCLLKMLFIFHQMILTGLFWGINNCCPVVVGCYCGREVRCRQTVDKTQDLDPKDWGLYPDSFSGLEDWNIFVQRKIVILGWILKRPAHQLGLGNISKNIISRFFFMAVSQSWFY